MNESAVPLATVIAADKVTVVLLTLVTVKKLLARAPVTPGIINCIPGLIAVLAAVKVRVVLDPEVEPTAVTVTAVSGTTLTTRKGAVAVTRVLPCVPEVTTPPVKPIAESPVVVLPEAEPPLEPFVTKYMLDPMKDGFT